MSSEKQLRSHRLQEALPDRPTAGCCSLHCTRMHSSAGAAVTRLLCHLASPAAPCRALTGSCSALASGSCSMTATCLGLQELECAGMSE